MTDEPKGGPRIVINGKEYTGEDLRQMLADGQIPQTVISVRKASVARRAGCSCGCIGGLLGLIGGGIGILVGILAVFSPNLLSGLMGAVFGISIEQSRPVQGDPARYDFSATYADVVSFAGEGAALLSFRAQNVRSDGTLDLTANYNARIDLEFAREVPRPADAPPLGAGGGPGPYYEPIQIEIYKPGTRRNVSRSEGGTRFTYQYINEGMTRRVRDVTNRLSDQPAPTPECTLAELWAIARDQGAPADAVADIDYGSSGYAFRISEIGINLGFGMNCRLRE